MWAVLTAQGIRQPGLKLILLCGSSSNTSSTAAVAPTQEWNIRHVCVRFPRAPVVLGLLQEVLLVVGSTRYAAGGEQSKFSGCILQGEGGYEFL